MNKLKLSAILVLAVLTLGLASCATGRKPNTQNQENANGGADNDGGSSSLSDDGYIFTENSDLTLVLPEGNLTEENFEKVFYAFSTLKMYDMTDGSKAPAKHEIVFGRCEREISTKAYRILDQQDKNDPRYTGFVIYSDGNSLAIAFDESRYGLTIAQYAAIDCFVNDFIKSDSLKVAKGAAKNESFDMVEYLEELDKETELQKWNRARERLEEICDPSHAEAIIASLKNLYRIYNDDVITWLINLYDPDVGGFYYSNSARNTEGYLPDLESTTQALGILRNSGMANNLAGGSDELIPDKMKTQIVKWVKGLQDPENGYFYHPQWGKFTTDQFVSRRGRDLQWATNILKNFGSAPTYDTPLGAKGDGITAEEYETPHPLTMSLNESKASAVSRVKGVADGDAGVPEHLLNDVNFKTYLNTLNIKTTSYGAGNTLESQALEIIQRDKVLAERGESYSLVEILYSFLNENQNKTTGLWQADGATDYNAVNGLLKISSTYTKIGKPVPNALVAIDAAMKCIASDEEPEHVCDVLNPWYAVTVVLENIETYSAEDGTAAADAIRAEIINDAPNLIEVTLNKVSLFVKEDGSFSYYKTQSAPNSQGLPTAVPKTNEGDVNATMICLQSIPGHIFTSLGISRIPHCYEADRVAFLIELEELSTIVKDKKDDERKEALGRHYKAHGGECYEATTVKALRTILRSDYYINYDVGFEYYENDNQLRKKQEFYNLKEDETTLSTVMEYGKSSEAGHYRGLYLRQTKSVGAECMIFETELKIDTVSPEALEKITASSLPYLCDVKIAQITIEKEGEVNVNECFDTIARIYVTQNESGDYVYRLGPAVPVYLYSEDILGPEMKLDRWNTISVELYSNGIAKYFCNNRYFTEMKFTDDLSGFNVADAVRFSFSPDAVNSAVHIDKTFVGKISQTYAPGNNYINVDGYEFKAGNYFDDFGGYEYSNQPNSDSADLFRASWYVQWGENLYSSHMTNPKYMREVFTVFETVGASGHKNDVVEYGKGSFPNYYNGMYYAMSSDATKGNVYVFETDFRLGSLSNETLTKLSEDGCYMDITLAKFVTTKSGDFDLNESIITIGGVYVTKNSDGNYVYYLTDRREKYSEEDSFGLAIPAAAWSTLTVEVYEDGTAKYYVNGVAMGDRKLNVDTETLKSADVLRISLTEQALRSSVLLDNTFFGKVNKEYTENSDYIPTGEEYPEWPSDSEVFPENQKVLTYENGKVPGLVSSALVTEGAAATVKDMMMDGKETKALVFTTKAGGNDYMNFRPTVMAESFNAISFETDMMITNETGTVEFAIEPITASSSRAFRLNVKAYEGKVYVYATGLPSVLVGNMDEWIHLRIDYMNPKIDYNQDGVKDILYKVYIGGSTEPLAVCYSPYNANIYEPSDIATVRFFMFNPTDADICFDNTSFMQLTLEADPAPSQPEPPKEPEVEPDTPNGPGHTEGENIYDENGWAKENEQ